MLLIRQFALTLLLVGSLSGCIKPKLQVYWEQKAASHTIRRLHLYDSVNPGVLKTNVGQVFTNVDDRPYPIEFHREFQRYGRFAGFTNSFYEKYVFVPEVMTNLVKQGRPVLMNSQPFPDSENGMQRLVIYQYTWQGEPTYAYTPLPEEFIQNAFKQVGVRIPEAPRFPPAPPIPPPPPVPFDQKVHEYFRNLAVQIGMSSYHGRVLERIAAGLGVVSLVIVCSLAFRWARRRTVKS
jgi:hypothetical protein